MKFKKLRDDVKNLSYAHPGDAGLDIYSLEKKNLNPGEHYIFVCGFSLEFAEGYSVLVVDKSSISKAGLHTMGGVFDAGYRGEYNVHLVNLSDKTYTIENGDKIAQLIIFPIAVAEIEEVDELSDSSRGSGSFGSTGRK